MSDITELKRMLADRAQAVAEYLLPAGKFLAGEWTVGSANGEPGKSLKVCVKGPKSGIWSDFAEGTGGDLIDLWRATKGQTLVEALTAIRGWLGVEKPQYHTAPTRHWTRPKKPQCQRPQARVMDYLREDRNLPDEVIERYQVGEQGDEIVFPFMRDGELILAKIREAKDGANPKPTEANCEKILFGWQAIDDNTRHVVITEGEIDAMSMAAYGYPALSVPYGGGGGNKQDWIESEYDRLGRFETIFLALDNDTEGQLAVDEIVNRLGRHRCRVVRLPHKDANECLVAGVPQEAIVQAIEESETLDPESLRRPIEYLDGVVRLFWPAEDDHVGYTLPYRSVAERLQFRPAEVTVWTGASGSGKSQLLSDATVHWIDEGSRVCMASLEMAPVQTLKRMVKQASDTDRPSEEIINAALGWLNGGLLLFDLVGKAKVDRLLEAFDYAHARYGCNQFVVDSLMRLGLETDDYSGQEAVMFRLVEWAVEKGVHIHLVAHSRKGERGVVVPETEDIKGAMELGANAFNIITVWRNRKREEAMAKEPEDEKQKVERERFERQAGVVLNVAKQRNGDWEGKCALWFNQATYQYRSRQDLPRRQYAFVEMPVEDVA